MIGPKARRSTRALALTVLDMWHQWGRDPICYAEWARVMRRGRADRSEDTCRRQWDRLKLAMLQQGYPHRRVRTMSEWSECTVSLILDPRVVDVAELVVGPADDGAPLEDYSAEELTIMLYGSTA